MAPSWHSTYQTERPEAISKPSAKAKCHARSADFERKLKRRFLVNNAMLASAHNSLDSTLLNLPDEILFAIFTSLDEVFAQVALALTCKRLALIARDVDLSLSVISRKYAGFLPATVFDVPLFMRSLRPWMPDNLLLCSHCLTYRPHGGSASASASASDNGYGLGNQWIQRVSWEFGNGRWQMQVNDICPLCNATCTFSDFVKCDGCRALGRLGNVDWSMLERSPRPALET